MEANGQAPGAKFDVGRLCQFANSLGSRERNNLLNSEADDEGEYEQWQFGRHEREILDLRRKWDIDGRVLQISDKLFQVRVPKAKVSLGERDFDLLEALDFSRPFLKEFSKAKLEVLKKSYSKSGKRVVTKKFPKNFVPLKKENVIKKMAIQPKIDFKPFPQNSIPHLKKPKITLKKIEKMDKRSKKSKMRELVNIMKKHVEPDVQKEAKIKEKNELDAMFDDIFAED